MNILDFLIALFALRSFSCIHLTLQTRAGIRTTFHHLLSIAIENNLELRWGQPYREGQALF